MQKRKRMKNGWKLDGNGNIEHAWNDYIRMDEQGLNRIKLDVGKQWIMDGKWIEIMDEAWMKNRWQWMKWLEISAEWMKNGWKRLENAWKWTTNEKKMDRRCSKKSFSKDFGLLPQKTALGSQTWNDGYFCYCGQIVFENQLCVSCARNTHSMFRVPDLFWLTGAVFRNISVTHSKFSKRKKSSKTWDFGPRVETATFRIPLAISKRSF